MYLDSTAVAILLKQVLREFKDTPVGYSTQKHVNSEVQKPDSASFFSPDNHLSRPLRKQKLSSTSSKVRGLWFMIGGFRSMFWFSVFRSNDLDHVVLFVKPKR